MGGENVGTPSVIFGTPFIDVDEWRDAPRRHRYMHGGFEGTDTRFSFYFPPEDDYKGRLFQFLSGGAGGDEKFLAAGIWMAWAFDTVFDELGGFLVESNQGHFADSGSIGVSGDLELFIASAETGLYAKKLAEEVYGSAPHHSYIWGGSGGGLRSIACIENRPDVWDGDVSFAIGESSGSSLPLTMAYWWLYCRHKLPEILDATEPGGQADPFESLTHDERQALAAVYRGGYPRGAENQMWASASWMFGMGGLRAGDPAYFDEFWTRPGYLGHDHPERLRSVLVDITCEVTKVHTGDGPGQLFLPRFPGVYEPGEGPRKGDSYGVEVDADLGSDPNRYFMARATVLSGRAEGRELYIKHDGQALVGERMTSPEMFDEMQVGDRLHIDNRDLVAFAHRWMYSILDRWLVDDPVTGRRALAPEFQGLAPTMVDGRPIYPQRSSGMLPGMMTGRVTRPMIHISGTHETVVPIPSVALYHRLVRQFHGDQADDYYRLWWAEGSGHGDEKLLPWTTSESDPGVWRSRVVNTDGMVQQALVSIVEWVEQGIAPPSTTRYRISTDSGLVLAPTAAERGSVQPVVQALANGAVRTDVKVGEAVRFTGMAEQPPGTGTIVSARWDFEGIGDFGDSQDLPDESAAVKVEATHTYDRPGTYFASFRAAGHRDGNRGRGAPIQNGARVRVVVSQS
jgi:hypothetical protein